GKCGGCGSSGEIGVRLRAAHTTHRIGAAVLLVVGMQYKKHVQRASQHRVGHELGLRHFPEHVHEVFGVVQVVVGVHVREAEAMAVGICPYCRPLGNEANNL